MAFSKSTSGFAVLLLLLAVDLARAHGGRVAADGCHNDRSTGTRHCHTQPGGSERSPQRGVPQGGRTRSPAQAGACADIRYNRKEWSFRGRKFSTQEGFYSGRQCQEGIDADHVVSLKDAHSSGGCHWSSQQKFRFANDPDNLVPSCASINRSKGSSLPAAFVRKASDGRGVDFNFPRDRLCGYLHKYKEVKEKYRLSFSANKGTLFRQCGLEPASRTGASVGSQTARPGAP